MEEPTRLSKVVAAQLGCSRSDAERYIAEGWVRVDGQVVHAPQFRVAGGRVEVDAKARLQPKVAATLLLHKPAGVSLQEAEGLLRAEALWEGDRSGLRPVKAHFLGLAHLLPLPALAAGLAVFSQERGVVRRLREDLVEEELLAEVSGQLVEGGLARLASAASARVSWQSEARLRFAMKGVDPARVPGLCAAVGLTVVALKRIRVGRVPMAGLPEGHWRYLLAGERF